MEHKGRGVLYHPYTGEEVATLWSTFTEVTSSSWEEQRSTDMKQWNTEEAEMKVSSFQEM